MHALTAVLASVASSITVMSGAVLLVATSPTTAYGDPTCAKTDPDTGECLITVPTNTTPSPTPTTPDPGNTGDTGRACYWDGTDQGVTKPPPGPVPCTSDTGYWSNAYNCYIERLDPQPDPGDPAWQDHEPGDGAIYSCYQPQTDILIPIWAANPPPGASTGPSPEEVAQIAIERMELHAIDVGITPDPVEADPDSLGIVGLPIYLWVQEPKPTTLGPITESASAGTITVTATAKVERIEWVMGDGTTVTCSGANAQGTPYTDGRGTQPSPTCGHTYEQTSWDQPNHLYTVTGRSYWRIDWSGAGQSGTIRLGSLERTVHLRIGEAQVLTR